MTEEIKSILTPKLFVTLIIVAILSAIINLILQPYTTLAGGLMFYHWTLPLIVLFAILLLSMALPQFKKLLNRPKLGLLYVAIAMGVVFSYQSCPYAIIHNAITMKQTMFEWWPFNWAVKDSWVFGPITPDYVDVATQFTTGGVPVPWGAWSPFVEWWMAYCALWLLFWVGWWSIVHERWIDVEKLPYPSSMAATMQISMAIEEKEKIGGRLKYFLLGAVLGLVFQLPVIANMLNPSIPDIYAGYASGPNAALMCVTVPALHAFPVMDKIATCPYIYIMFYIFPTKILFSVWFFQVVFMLIPEFIAYNMGYYSGIADVELKGQGPLSTELPFKWNEVWNGIYIGLLLMWIVLSIPYLKGLFKKAPDEDKKFLPFPIKWILIIASTTGLFSMMVVAGTSMISAVVMILSLWLLFFAVMRVYGFATTDTLWFGYPIVWRNYPYMVKYLYTSQPYWGVWAPPPAEYVTTMHLSNQFTTITMAEDNVSSGLIFAIPMSVKVASDSGVHPRDIMKVMIVAGLLSAMIGFPFALWWSYTIGSNNFPVHLWDNWWQWVMPNFGAIEGQPSVEPALPWLFGGIAIMVVLSILNFRFIWWPLDPAGVALAINGAETLFLFPALVAWVVKKLVFRLGGTKLNDTIALPVSIGFIVGYWVMFMIGTLGGIIKFFLAI